MTEVDGGVLFMKGSFRMQRQLTFLSKFAFALHCQSTQVARLSEIEVRLKCPFPSGLFFQSGPSRLLSPAVSPGFKPSAALARKPVENDIRMCICRTRSMLSLTVLDQWSFRDGQSTEIPWVQFQFISRSGASIV